MREGVPPSNDDRSPLLDGLIELLQTLYAGQGAMVDLLSAMNDIQRNLQEALDDLDARVCALEPARDSDPTAESARLGEQDGHEALRRKAAQSRRRAQQLHAASEQLIAESKLRTADRQRRTRYG